MIRALSGAILLACIGAPAMADDCPFTVGEATAVAQARKLTEPAASFKDYGGPDAAALLKAINDDPPQTDYVAFHILVFARPDLGAVRVQLAIKGCVRRATTLTTDRWLALRDAAFGVPL